MKKIIELHKFFVKESRSFVGKPVKDKSKPLPVWGENKWWRKFDPNEHERLKYTIVGIDYPIKYVYSFRQILQWPVAYIKFMFYSIKDGI